MSYKFRYELGTYNAQTFPITFVQVLRVFDDDSCGPGIKSFFYLARKNMKAATTAMGAY